MSFPAKSHVLLTEEALKTLAAMKDRVYDVGQKYGENSPERMAMALSLLNVWLSLFRLGGRVTADDELSLYGSSFMQYGVVFFPKRADGVTDPLLGEWSTHS